LTKWFALERSNSRSFGSGRKMPSHAPVISVAIALVGIAGGFLVTFGVAALFAPLRVKTFLLGFAVTRLRHLLELALRLAIGMAFVLAAPRLPGSAAFVAVGAVLLATTLAMALLPFRLHKAFAERSVPAALPHLSLIGFASIVAGLAIAWAVYVAGIA
jgi:hypothetical protein